LKLAFILIFLLIATTTNAEVIPVEQVESGLSISSTPTQTLYWQGVNSKALILFIPGGDGHLGLKPGQTDLEPSLYQTLKSLTNPSLSSGKYDVVLLDSPSSLSQIRERYPSARGTSDHLIRIESVIQFYHKKTGLPIWLMGHSNGGISLTNFIQYLQKSNKTNEIAGVIASAVRSESYFNPPIDFPMLFLHHEKDGCFRDDGNHSYKNYLKVKEFSKSDTKFIWITTGETEGKEPCNSGFHMYYNAGPEVSKAIDDFLSQFYK
jgi:hypothetical protein